MNANDWFSQEMAKVSPLNSTKKRTQKTKKRKHEILRSLERKEVCQQQHVKSVRLHSKRTDVWLLRADGVSSKVIKKLAQTNIPHEIDLHGLNQNEAILTLSTFFQYILTENTRKISIIHGKGNHSKGKSVLKEATYHWLEYGEFSSYILAATPASQSKGGACHVLLRKKQL